MYICAGPPVTLTRFGSPRQLVAVFAFIEDDLFLSCSNHRSPTKLALHLGVLGVSPQAQCSNKGGVGMTRELLFFDVKILMPLNRKINTQL